MLGSKIVSVIDLGISCLLVVLEKSGAWTD